MGRKFLLLGILVVGILLVTFSLLAGVSLGRFIESEQIDFPFGRPVATQVTVEPALVVTVPLTTTAVPAATPISTTTNHTLLPGESLSYLAQIYDVALEDIIAVNGITDADQVFAGQVLAIPVVADVETVVADNQIITKPAFVAINGLPDSNFIILSPAAVQRARAIYARGQELGRNPNAYAKIGDSTTENPFFMARFDDGQYNLGDYAYLQDVIDKYRGSHARDSVAVRVGLHSWTIFDPAWADKAVCGPAETPIECEFRLHNPSVVFLRLGSNDAGAPQLFDESIRQIVEYAIDQGVIPIIGTKADRVEGSNENNDILRQIAVDYQLPLWEFDLVAGTVADRGLDVDGVHMSSFYAHDYTLPEALQRGHALHNLSALMMLDTLWKEVILPAEN